MNTSSFVSIVASYVASSNFNVDLVARLRRSEILPELSARVCSKQELQPSKLTII